MRSGSCWYPRTGGERNRKRTESVGQRSRLRNRAHFGGFVDVDGFIWAIPDNSDRAYRVDPTDLSYVKIGGLIGAYTYSDLSGGSLKSVACNPPG